VKLSFFADMRASRHPEARSRRRQFIRESRPDLIVIRTHLTLSLDADFGIIGQGRRAYSMVPAPVRGKELLQL
jgi:hypothetical protein